MHRWLNAEFRKDLSPGPQEVEQRSVGSACSRALNHIKSPALDPTAVEGVASTAGPGSGGAAHIGVEEGRDPGAASLLVLDEILTQSGSILRPT